MKIREFLDEQKRLADAASDGWRTFITSWSESGLGVENPHNEMVFWDAGGGITVAQPGDATFIASARTSVPRLVAGLESVLGVHRRSHGVFSWATGEVRYEEPCPECDGKAGVHPCGCSADQDMDYVCSECKTGTRGESVAWPCPTVKVVSDALGD